MIRPRVIGVCIAIVLAALGLNISQWQWWAAIVPLNIAFNFPEI